MKSLPTIDAYTPFKVVNSIIQNSNYAKPLSTIIYPHWQGVQNGHSHLKKFVEMTKIDTLMIDLYPFETSTSNEFSFNKLREQFQYAHEAKAGFWYIAQAFGIKDSINNFCWLRKPISEELNASIMLALSYGSKGILPWKFQSTRPSGYEANCGYHSVSWDAILDSTGDTTYLYNYLKDDLVPRLKGTLGKTLLALEYTGVGVDLISYVPAEVISPSVQDYLTLHLNGASCSGSMDWRAGLLEKENYDQDYYFLLSNLIPWMTKSVYVAINQPVPGYQNYRFRDIEGSFDTTFNVSFTKQIFHQGGEGKLYQVSPVIKYGGKLAYNDTVKYNGTELIDNMSVKNGVTLSIMKDITYIVEDTISLEGTGFISGQGYLDLSQGTINSVHWSKSLFKGVNGNHPLLYIRKPLTESAPTDYTVYRKIGTMGFTYLDNFSGTATEYIDSTVDISTANPITEYYFKASFSSFAVNTNIVRYDRTDGNTESLILPGGWQTVSVPVIMTESSIDTVLGTNSVFKFSGGYHGVSTLENGVGYWANFFTGPDTIIFTGTPVDTLAMPVVSGWNLKGSLFYNIFVSQVYAEPDTIIESIFKYVTGYGYVPFSGDSILKPGIGYWIKTNDSGTVYMEENLGKITSLPDINFAIMDKFIIQDAGGNKQTLYVTNTDLDTISINADFEMPPYYSELPFDSRFGLSDLVKKVSAAAGPVDLDILVQALSYPVTLSWQLNPANCINYSFIGDSILGKVSGLGEAVFTSLDSGKIKLTAFADKEGYKTLLPKEFELLQNYPNPFNPNTRIKYSVAEERRVSLIVYNILGQQVAVLKDEIQRPGYYELNFDASSLSSGVYLYTLQAGNYINTKKLIVLK